MLSRILNMLKGSKVGGLIGTFFSRFKIYIIVAFVVVSLSFIFYFKHENISLHQTLSDKNQTISKLKLSAEESLAKVDELKKTIELMKRSRQEFESKDKELKDKLGEYQEQLEDLRSKKQDAIANTEEMNTELQQRLNEALNNYKVKGGGE